MLDADDVRRAVPMPAAVEAVREAFLDLAAGRFVVPQRMSFAGATTLVMTACHTPSSTTVVKTLNLVPGRTPMILGTLVWNTAEGQVVADAVEITALRTGAVSGVATDLLAAPSASRLALLGTGAQAADQVRAVAAVRPVRHVAVFGRDASRASAFAERLRAESPEVAVRVASSAPDAVSDARSSVVLLRRVLLSSLPMTCRHGCTSTRSGLTCRPCGNCPPNCSPPRGAWWWIRSVPRSRRRAR